MDPNAFLSSDGFKGEGEGGKYGVSPVGTQVSGWTGTQEGSDVP